jgi:hypothetical protein
MILVKYSKTKLFTWGVLCLFLGFFSATSVIGVLLGIFLIFGSFRLLYKASIHDESAVIHHARGLEIRTIWGRKFISYDHYVTMYSEVIPLGVVLPFFALTQLTIEYNKGQILGKKKVQILMVFLNVNKNHIPQIAEIADMFALSHREAGSVWHQAWDEKVKERGYASPPEQLMAIEEKKAKKRDSLEGTIRKNLDEAPKSFGRKEVNRIL